MTLAPARITWAVEQLKVKGSDRILEVGCGRGVAAALTCERLHTGQFTGLDRSAIAIAAATESNREHIRSGKASFVRVALANANLGTRFDKIFAINVNVFWLNPVKELSVILNLLAPRGQLYLFYELPSSSQLNARPRLACSTSAPMGLGSGE